MSSSSNHRAAVARFPAHKFILTIPFAILIGVAILLHFTAPASAAIDAVFIVDSIEDGVDAAPGDGICATEDGDCTVRAAVQEANAQPGVDTIQLGAGVHKLSIAGKNENSGATGDLDVTDGLLILGAEAGSTVSADWLDRVIHLSNGAELSLVNITLTKGTAEGDSATDAGLGGALLVDVGSTIGISGGRMVQNRATSGGAIFVRNSTASIDGVTFAGNVATETGGGMTIGESTATVSDVIFESNVAGARGGGLYTVVSDVTITEGLLSSNAADFGGGLALMGGVVQIESSEVDSNNASEQGGGLWISGGATIVRSSITRNGSAVGAGVAVVPSPENDAGDAVALFEETLFEENSSIGPGGAIWSSGALSLQRSIMGVNNAGSGGTDLHIAGDETARAEVVNNFFNPMQLDAEVLFETAGTTIVVNTLGSALLLNNTLLGGNGLSVTGVSLEDGSLTMMNTIMAGFLVGIEQSGGTLTNDYNLFFENEAHAADIVVGANSLIDIDPMLDDEVGDLLRQRSPAAEAGNDDACPLVDRLGQPRPKDGGGDLVAHCDIGSYETQFPVNEPPIALSDLITITRDDVVSLALPFVVPVLENDSDPNNDPLTVVSTTLPSHGTIEFNTDGTISYKRTPNFNGTDAFTYTISDGRGETASALVELLVIPGLTIGEDVSFGDNWQIGDGTIIGRGVLLGDDIRLGTSMYISKLVTITQGALIGNNVSLFEGAVIGQDASIGSDSSIGKFVPIGNGASIGERVTVLANSSVGAATTIGDDVYLAKQVQIGSEVVINNGVRIEKNTQIGDGTMIGADALIEDGTTIGRAVVIEPSATIWESVMIGDQSHVGTGAFIDEDSVVGAGVSIGMNTTINEMSHIGDGAQIGEAVVLLDEVEVGAAATIADRVQMQKRVRVGSRAQIGVDVIVEKDSVIGEGANVKPNALIKAGAMVDVGARIGSSARVGKRSTVGEYSIISDAAFISDDSMIGANVQIGSGSKLGNHVYLGNESTLGVNVELDHGAQIHERVNIGAETEVRLEAVVGADSSIGIVAVIEDKAQLGERVRVGNGARVHAGVVVPADTVIPDEPAEVVGASLRLRQSNRDIYVQLLPMVVGE